MTGLDIDTQSEIQGLLVLSEGHGDLIGLQNFQDPEISDSALDSKFLIRASYLEVLLIVLITTITSTWSKSSDRSHLFIYFS